MQQLIGALCYKPARHINRPIHGPVELQRSMTYRGHSITTWTRGGGWVVSKMSINFYEGKVGGQLSGDVVKRTISTLENDKDSDSDYRFLCT